MYKNKKILALICARSGSKGLKNKNTIDFCGKPMIQWSALAAKGSKYIDEIIVSTDCQKIADHATNAGARVPFLRPRELASDISSIEDVIHHGINWISQKEHKEFDIILLLQPTSPLRTNLHIDEALKKYIDDRKSESDTLVSVCSVPKKMGWIMKKNEEDCVNFCLTSPKKGLRRQEVVPFFIPNGALYIASTKHFKHSFFTERTLFFEMDKESSVDIDTMEDLQVAKSFFKKKPHKYPI